jgi:hypothetical protein
MLLILLLHSLTHTFSVVAAPTFEPTLAPTSAPTLSGFEAIADTLLTVTPYSVLTDPTTPQNAAMSWLMREDEYGIDFGSSSKLLQRYSLATIYFATGGGNWTNQLQFLTNQDDCFWNDTIGGGSFGVIECNDQGLATKLQLCKFNHCVDQECTFSSALYPYGNIIPSLHHTIHSTKRTSRNTA